MLGLIDESVPISVLGIHYVISAAVLLDPDQHDEIRTRAAAVIGSRHRLFHWREEGVEKRQAMIQLLGQLDIGVFATIHRPVSPSREREARRAALTDLVVRLDKEGVEDLFIESRGARLDADDERTLIAGRLHGLWSPQLAYAFKGKDEPLLWLPDAVSGLLTEAERGIGQRWLAEMQRAVEIFDVRRLD